MNLSITNKAYKVENIKTGELNIYSTQRECAKATGISTFSVSRYTRDNAIKMGLRFSYIENGASTQKTYDYSRRPVKVYNLTNGKEYSSMREASLAIGCSSSFVCQCIKSNKLCKENKLSFESPLLFDLAEIEIKEIEEVKSIGHTYSSKDAAMLIDSTEKHVLDMIESKYLNDPDFKIKTKTITVIDSCEMNSKGYGKLYASITAPSPMDMAKAKFNAIKK